ncbi:hypothetical protein NDU88_000332 [Pleurodeles waltl]|uniref:Uncharacterized protein n=1 Tax=Pleurodeles waltl TaxID=8319 RepID=A0AAV7UPP7_PLEWA|nr:hypothetical protein NDU88_000332 [Pleurodeles waltl]
MWGKTGKGLSGFGPQGGDPAIWSAAGGGAVQRTERQPVRQSSRAPLASVSRKQCPGPLPCRPRRADHCGKRKRSLNQKIHESPKAKRQGRFAGHAF